MTSPEVSQHKIKFELPEVTLGDQNQWHNLFSSQPDRFSTYLFGDNIEYSQGKRPHNKKKGKSIPILANKITPFIFYAENINFFPFHINGFFFFFFFNGWNTQQESLYPRTLPILMKSRFNPRFGTKSRELSWSLLILIFNVKAPHLIVNETDFPPKTDQYCFTLTYLSLYTFHNHLQGTLTKSSVETNSNCHSIKADGLIKSYSEATFPMFQVN